ncbi:MAG: hypothetical protein AAFQ15_17215 [Pseudomonadota bacterium]
MNKDTYKRVSAHLRSISHDVKQIEDAFERLSGQITNRPEADAIHDMQRLDHVQQRLSDLAVVFHHFAEEAPKGTPLAARLSLEETRRIVCDLPEQNDQAAGDVDLF